MTHNQIHSLLGQIAYHSDRLALPLSDRDCISSADSRKALRLDIIATIEYLYDRSFIDSLLKDELLSSLSDAFIYGGL